MIAFFKRLMRAGLSGMVVLALSSSNAFGQESVIDRPATGSFYVQGFGGVGSTGTSTATQQGVAFFPEAMGGPLAVNGLGTASSQTVGIGGLNFGYEFRERCNSLARGWGLRPAAEFEVFYADVTRHANIAAPGPRLPEHNFLDSLPTRSVTFLANAILNIRTPWERVTPYVGFGIGTSYQSIHSADSFQNGPPEAGINHFNSIPHATDWGFTTQIKAGVRVNLTDRVWFFSEYRLLTVGATSYTFGSTQYANHVPTTSWNVGLGTMSQSIGVAGIGFRY
ncbi:MAG: outer membrane beta-barrel protein [Planctomycetes bacterium]|nr:outer membrane beta-barrel protein [Planctomycetota bacterium]